MMKFLPLFCLVTLGHALSIYESGNMVHISGINGHSHGEIGVYPNHRGEAAVLTYHTDDKIACSHLRIQIYRGQNQDANKLVTSLCNDDVMEISTEGFKIVFDSDSSVHNAAINIKIKAPHGFFSYYKYKEANGKDDIKELVYEDSRSHLATDG